MARALVTGGQGFIGGHLCSALLERGDSVVVLDLPDAPGRALHLHQIRDDVELLEGDVADKALTDRAVRGASSVFHLAAQTLVGPAAADPGGTFRSNVEGTWSLLESCRLAGVDRVVVASSDKAYGPSDQLPYKEEHPLLPSAPYEASKAATDVIGRSYWSSWGLAVGVTRLANVYGGGDLNFSRLIPELVSAYIDDRAPEIRSDGSPRRDFLHVFDAVAAYLAIHDQLPSGAGEAFNAGTGRPLSVREVIGAVKDAVGSDREPDFLSDASPKGEIDSQFVDASKLRQATGWAPRVSFEEGLSEAVDWYRRHPDLRPPSR